MISKPPPHNLDAERAVLGGILLNNDSIDRIINIVSPLDFYREGHQTIFDSMLCIYEESEVIDFVTLSEHITKKGKIEKCGGNEYITSLIDGMSTSAGITYHAEIIRDLSVRRRLIISCSNTIESCFDKSLETKELIELAEHGIHDIAQVKSDVELSPMNDVMKESFKEIERAYSTEGSLTGLPTGFHDLDRMTAGLQPTDLIVLAGRPSMGKTAFAINVAYNASKVTDKAIAIFSLEMSKESLGVRLISLDSGVDSNKLRTGTLKDDHWSKITDSANKLSGFPMYIDDRSGISILDMRSALRKIVRLVGDIALVVIDYLGLVEGEGYNRENEVANITKGAKALAKDFGAPVLLLSQLNRKVEDRPDKRPHMADLRDSGSTEQDSDLILFMYRDEQYNKNADNKGKAELIIAKQRNGATGKIDLLFKKEQTRFDNLYKE